MRSNRIASQHGSLFEQVTFSKSLCPEHWRTLKTGHAMHDQLRNDFARRWRVHHPVTAEAVREKHPFNARSAADNRMMVRRHFIHPRPTAPWIDFDIGKNRDPAHGSRQDLLDKAIVEVCSEAVALLRIGPGQKEARTFGAKMKPARHIDHHRQPRRELFKGLGFYDLTAQGLDRDFDSGKARNSGSPRSGGVDHSAGRHVSTRSLNAGDVAMLDNNARNIGLKPYHGATLACAFGEAGHHAIRVDEAVGRTNTPSHDIVGDQLWNGFQYVFTGNHFRVIQPARLLLLEIGPEIIKVMLICSYKKIALCTVARGMTCSFFKSREEVDRIKRHPDVDRGRKLSAHPTHAFGRGTH